MNIKKFFGLQTQAEKIREYRRLCRCLISLDREAGLLADSFALQKSQVDDLVGADIDIQLEISNRFNAFVKQHTKDVVKLCNRKTNIEKSLQNLEKDEEIVDAIQEIKQIQEVYRGYKRGEFKKSVFFDILKAKSGGPVKYADVLLFRGDKLLILQRAGEDGSHSDEWCIPGGHVDPGETFIEAAVRELQEETGIQLDEGCFFEAATYKNKDAEIHYFIGHVDDQSPVNVVVDAMEEIGSAWINPTTELDKYKFIFDMKDNLEQILGIQKLNPTPMILKALMKGDISEKVYKDWCLGHQNDIRKAQNKTYFSHGERKDLAKKGEAMPNGKYPIRNKQDLHDAIKLVGSSSMPEGEVKAWIKKRAKALDLTSELPEDWVEKAEDTNDAQTLARESLDEKEKNVTHPQSEEERTDPAKGPIDKSELEDEGEENIVKGGFGIHIEFNDMDQANMFKSLVEEWASSGKLDIASIKEVDEDIHKATFTEEEREKLADEGEALPDGKYPIRNASDLRNAIRLVGNSKLPKSEVEAWIKKRAKELDLESELPEDWSESKKKEDDLEKAKDPGKKKLFLDFINFLQGMVTRKDNLHWSELDNSKHVYLDSVGDELNDFKDTLAESGQSIFGRFDANTVKAEEVEENDPLKFIKLLFERVTDFREALEGDRDYFGELSYIDDFLVKTKQSMYRLQMH